MNVPATAPRRSFTARASAARAALWLSKVSTGEQTVENQRPGVERFARARGVEVVMAYEEPGSGAMRTTVSPN